MAIAFNPSQPPSIGGIGQGIGRYGGFAPNFNIPGIQINIMTGGIGNAPGMMGAMHGFGSQYAGMNSLYNQIPGHGAVPGIRPPSRFGIHGTSSGSSQIIGKQDEMHELRNRKDALEEKLDKLRDAAKEYESNLKDKDVEIIGKNKNIEMTEVEKGMNQDLKITEESKKAEFETIRNNAQKKYDAHQYVNYLPWNIAKTIRHKRIRNNATNIINESKGNIKKVNNKIADLNDKLNKNNVELDELNKEKDILIQEKIAIQSEYNPIKAELEALEDELKQLEFEEERLSDDIDDLRN